MELAKFDMNDLTVIYLTASLIPERFAVFQRKILLEAIGDTPLISVSRKPLNFGRNIQDNGQKGISNIYYQMFRAINIATTDYIAIAEDDVLYNKEHFTFYRPGKDTFAYNLNRFALFTWDEPVYSWRYNKSNAALIAPRKLALETLKERFNKYPNGTPIELSGELGKVEERLGLPIKNTIDVYTYTSIIQFNHDFATEAYQRTHKKKLGPIQAYDIPYWGKAKELVKHFQ